MVKKTIEEKYGIEKEKDEIIHHKKGFICDCCKQKLKISINTAFGKDVCRYCYHTCESMSGLPRCYKERKRIGGYWTKGRKKVFIKE
jgi:hypothetical protein